MAKKSVISIIQNCLSLEKCALGFYRDLSRTVHDTDLQRFWKDMAVQEGHHIQYWKRLLNLAEHDRIKNIFDDPEQVNRELVDVKVQVNKLLEEKLDQLNLEKTFLTAYRLEFYLMHPAFEAMFHMMRKETGDSSPEDNYEGHINGLIFKLQELGLSRPDFEMIASLMKRVWDNNRQLAKQLADIHVLRGLIPICMHCKNVRDDKGFWGKVESYIEAHSEAQFSHGICPDCLLKYYPDLAGSEDS